MTAPRDDRRPSGALPLSVVAFCVAVFAVVLGLLLRDGSQDDSAARGFPVALAVLAVAALVFSVAWRQVTHRRR